MTRHLLLVAACLAGCAASPAMDAPLRRPPAKPAGPPPPATAATPTVLPNVVLKRGGGFYKDDGPADEIPDGLDDIPDAVPVWEPLHRPAMKPYVVLGHEYVPNTTLQPFRQRGIASWYGKKFHGQKTSIGEPYDMFAMTAAHPTLAIPSYVRVTNVETGKAVVVRVIDRGPFHAERIIDLSYTAAYKLGLVGGGSGQVEIEAIVPGSAGGVTYAQASPPVRPAERDEIAELARRLELEERPQSPAPAADSLPRGVYLQLGAFANADNAETLRNHLTRELDWLTESMRIAPGGGIHRVQLGPYPNRDAADRIAERIRLALGYKPTVVVR